MVAIDMSATGNRIYEAIQSKGLSILQVTDMMMLSQSAIYQWCWGRQIPTVDHLVELADLLGVQMEELLVIERR